MIASLLSAASILIAGIWKAPHSPATASWQEKARSGWGTSKLSAVVKYRLGNFRAVLQFRKQWCLFVKCSNYYYRMNSVKIRQVLDIIDNDVLSVC